MSDTTTKFLPPYILAAQAQKHVTHNQALPLLYGLVQMSVPDRDLTAPPCSPVEGDRYIVAPGAAGAWSGWDDDIGLAGEGIWFRLPKQVVWLPEIPWNGCPPSRGMAVHLPCNVHGRPKRDRLLGRPHKKCRFIRTMKPGRYVVTSWAPGLERPMPDGRNVPQEGTRALCSFQLSAGNRGGSGLWVFHHGCCGSSITDGERPVDGSRGWRAFDEWPIASRR